MHIEAIDGVCGHLDAEEMGRDRFKVYKLCPECQAEIVDPLPTFGTLEVRVTVTVPLTKALEEYTEEEISELVSDVESDAAPLDESCAAEVTWWDVR